LATLVFSTVGTILGGPIGGAIGALIGQSVDQQLLAPASRGPRLGDLAVQTSSYGTQIPRIYGAMRVAGSVVWATDLVEGEQTSGAKGQPDVVYSYSVSLAVALSSRPVGAVGRIWADGQLLRGAEGDFKVPVTFRFYDGSEDQEIDPLIASIEGIASTPAYRGFALAVFENLELAQFGNRIPFMTFEIIADQTPPAIGEVLGDASAGAIESDSGRQIAGYAAYGRSVAAAVQPLVDCFDVPLFDDGSVMRPPLSAVPVAIGEDEWGNSADSAKAPRIQREQLPVRDVASVLRLSYYDPERDYQAGEARAAVGEQSGNAAQQDLPAVLLAADAKALVQQMLARQWTQRDRLTLRLPPQRSGIEPGSLVELGMTPKLWRVDKCTIEAFVTILELRPCYEAAIAISADAGRIAASSDVVEEGVTVALLDMPDVLGAASASPTLILAGSSASSGWRSRPLTISGAGQVIAVQTARRKSILGQATTMLGDGSPWLVDETDALEVELVDANQWLTSCADDALAEGTNLALLGDELLQFAQASPLGEGRFRLSRLLRGRAGTEWAMSGHEAGDTFCLIQRDALQVVALPSWMTGATLTVADRGGASATAVVAANALKPFAPVNLFAGIQASGDLALSWTRRSRSGRAWLDQVDVPVGEAREQYRVSVSGAASAIEITCDQPNATIAAAQLSALGSGSATVEVRQVGDWAASPAAQATINL
jgi:hypothetical protein